jgi:uncharacterized protein
MGTYTNREAALRMLSVMETGKIDENLVTEDFSWWIAGQGAVSHDAFKKMSEYLGVMLAGQFSIKVHGVTAEGDRVAVEAESLAPLKNGRTYNNFYHYLFLFRSGKIYLIKEYNDTLHTAQTFHTEGA